MSVEQAIHEQWEQYKPLCDLVPINRVYTGQVPEADSDSEDVTRPYVGIMVDPKEEVIRTSSHNLVCSGNAMIGIYTDDLSTAKSIVTQIVNKFNRAGFDYSQGAVIDMKPGNENYSQDPDDGVWLATLTFGFKIVQSKLTGVA